MKNIFKRLKNKLNKNQIGDEGFTIVELLVATVVFSIALLTLTFGVIEMSKTYYKGINTSKTQNVARNIMDDISTAIEFGGGSVNTTPTAVVAGNTYAFCIGDRAYYYQLGYELKSGIAQHGMMVVNNDNNCPNNLSGYDLKAGTKPSGSLELLSPYMRLTRLKVSLVSGTNDLYSVDLQVTYGDDSLLSNPNAANGTGTHCLGGSGQQFCSTAELYSTVEKRVN